MNIINKDSESDSSKRASLSSSGNRPITRKPSGQSALYPKITFENQPLMSFSDTIQPCASYIEGAGPTVYPHSINFRAPFPSSERAGSSQYPPKTDHPLPFPTTPFENQLTFSTAPHLYQAGPYPINYLGPFTSSLERTGLSKYRSKNNHPPPSTTTTFENQYSFSTAPHLEQDCPYPINFHDQFPSSLERDGPEKYLPKTDHPPSQILFQEIGKIESTGIKRKRSPISYAHSEASSVLTGRNLEAQELKAVKKVASIIVVPDKSTSVSQPHNIDIPTKTECSICLENICDWELKRISCSHEFHKACIDKWLNIKRRCPLCRQVVAHHRNSRQHSNRTNVRRYHNDGRYTNESTHHNVRIRHLTVRRNSNDTWQHTDRRHTNRRYNNRQQNGHN